jgi:Glyoxalase/Bleomycin resistance protein/Dioxygenase superfamily
MDERKTRYWIAEADAKGKKQKHRIGAVGIHHYAFQLRNRKDVDGLHACLLGMKAEIVDPLDEYYDDYYAVFFLDPDGLKLKGMKYGEKTAKKRPRRIENWPDEFEMLGGHSSHGSASILWMPGAARA